MNTDKTKGAYPCSSAFIRGQSTRGTCKYCREAELSASARPLKRSRPSGEPNGARPSADAAVEAVPTVPRSRSKRCHPSDGTRKSTHGYGWAAVHASRHEPGVEQCEPQPRPPRYLRPARQQKPIPSIV